MKSEVNRFYKEEQVMETVQNNAAVTEAQTETKKVLSQKEAVFKFINEELQNSEVTVANLKDRATKSSEKKALMKRVRQKLFAGFKAGEIALKNEKDDSKLKKYCSSVINNWLKKDERYSN